MPRFNGTPVQQPDVQDQSKTGGRFGGVPIQPAPAGKHLSYEEGAALLDKEAQAGTSGGIGAFVTGAVEGVPIVGPALLGGVKRAAAGIGSMIDGDSYDTNLKQAQQITQDAQEQHPIATTGGRVAGAVIGTLPLIEAAPAAFGAQDASLAARALTGGAGGFGIGATDAAVRDIGTDKSVGDRVVDSLVSGGIGAATGALAPAIGNAAGATARYFGYGRSANQAAREAGTTRPAVDVVARALHADEALNGAQAANAGIQAAGPRAMLADAGPATMGQLDAAIARGGPNSAQASQRIIQRAEGATQDINAALDAGLGPDQGMVRPLDAIRNAAQPANSAAYEAAYARPIDYASPQGQTLQHIVETRVPANVIQRANNLMRINGEQSQQILANVADDGTVTFQRLPDVRQFDYITRALNDVSRAGDGQGALGGNTAEGRAYGNLSRTIRDILGSDEVVPEYRTALNTAAEPIQQREAMQFGQTMLNPTTSRDEVDGFVAGLTDPQLQAVRTGLRSRIAETLANVKRTAGDPNVDARQGLQALKDLSSDASRQKLAAVMGQTEADSMLRAIDQAGTAYGLRAGVARGSQTYGRQAAERVVDQATQPSFAQRLANLNPIQAARTVTSDILGAGPQAQQALKDETWGQIADLLTQQAAQGGGTVLQALQGAGRALPAALARGRVIDRAVTTGVGLGGGPLRQQLQGQSQ